MGNKPSKPEALGVLCTESKLNTGNIILRGLLNDTHCIDEYEAQQQVGLVAEYQTTMSNTLDTSVSNSLLLQAGFRNFENLPLELQLHVVGSLNLLDLASFAETSRASRNLTHASMLERKGRPCHKELMPTLKAVTRSTFRDMRTYDAYGKGAGSNRGPSFKQLLIAHLASVRSSSMRLAALRTGGPLKDIGHFLDLLPARAVYPLMIDTIMLYAAHVPATALSLPSPAGHRGQMVCREILSMIFGWCESQ